MTWIYLVLFLIFSLEACLSRLWAGEELRFLPNDLVFQPLIGDPREPHNEIRIQNGMNPYDGAIGSTIELLQWKPADQSRWGWGILGAGFIGLGSVTDASAYPDRVVHRDGFDIFNNFPERVSDWHLGTYFSQSSGEFSHRLEYLHISSHLGDELFGYVPRFIYTRESFRLTSSFQPSSEFRFYAGVGYWGHIDPEEKPFFMHAGTEIYSPSFGFIAGTTGRGYFTYDLKIKDEAGGVVNHAFQLGLQWKWKKETSQAIRFAVLYYNGNSEYGQFYKQRDDHWGFGIFFDP
jgi:hypothetical protein